MVVSLDGLERKLCMQDRGICNTGDTNEVDYIIGFEVNSDPSVFRQSSKVLH